MDFSAPTKGVQRLQEQIRGLAAALGKGGGKGPKAKVKPKLLAWVLACHEDPYTLFTVPPLEKGPT